jgi:hypothetical protein
LSILKDSIFHSWFFWNFFIIFQLHPSISICDMLFF